MSDTTVRRAERRWKETGSPDARSNYIRSLRRTGQDIPYDLHAQDTNLYTSLGVNKQGMSELRHKTTGMVFVIVPAGEFMMGPTTFMDDAAEEPQQVRRVFDEPFMVAKYPWTGREWHRVTGEFPSHFPTGEMVNEQHPELGPDEEGREDSVKPVDIRLNLKDTNGKLWGDHPVESVSWDRCREVEDWINRIDFARQFDAHFLWKDTIESEEEERPAVWLRWNSYVYGDDNPGLSAAALLESETSRALPSPSFENRGRESSPPPMEPDTVTTGEVAGGARYARPTSESNADTTDQTIRDSAPSGEQGNYLGWLDRIGVGLSLGCRGTINYETGDLDLVSFDFVAGQSVDVSFLPPYDAYITKGGRRPSNSRAFYGPSCREAYRPAFDEDVGPNRPLSARACWRSR